MKRLFLFHSFVLLILGLTAWFFPTNVSQANTSTPVGETCGALEAQVSGKLDQTALIEAARLDPPLSGVLNTLDTLDLYAPTNLGSKTSRGAVTVGIVTRTGVDVLGRAVPQVEEFLNIIDSSQPRIKEMVKSQISQWLIKNKIELKIAWPEDLNGLATQYKSAGFLDPELNAVAPNGYIANPFYAQLVQHGYFPVGDFHDLLSHLALFVFPEAVRAFQKPTEVFIEIEQLRLSLKAVHDPYHRTSIPKTTLVKAITGISEIIQEDFRFLTFESLLFKINQGSTDHLVFMGNHPLWLGSELDTYSVNSPPALYIDQFADLLFLENTSKETTIFPSNLPLRDEYLNQSPELWNETLKILNDIGLNKEGTFNDIHQRLVGHLQTTLDHFQVTVKTAPWGSSDFQEKFFSNLFLRLMADPKLDGALNIRNRWKLQEVASSLYEDYLRWVSQHQ